jgi:hypothetical protein
MELDGILKNKTKNIQFTHKKVVSSSERVLTIYKTQNIGKT